MKSTPATVDSLVFVYGTLKQGGSNHHFLAGQTRLGAATLRPGHALYSLGDYPGLVTEAHATEAVTGEIWRVTPAALAGLDELEGIEEGLYARVPAPLATWPDALEAREVAAVQMYLYLGSVSGRPRLDGVWPT